jgi:predicted RNA-binding Zn-ribbon protein involved in translation (DUF1610 family)
MTIREHFVRVRNRILWAAVCVMVALLGLIWWLSEKLTKLKAEIAFVVIVIILTGVLKRLFWGRFICPQCGTDLGKLFREEREREGVSARDDRREIWERWNACPKCGVSFDEDWGPIAPWGQS